MKKDDRYLGQALALAGQSLERMRHGAIVVRNGRVLGQAVNIRKNNPQTAGIPLDACSVHAEARALRRARFPRRADVYVARVGRAGEPRLSAPCAACAGLLEQLDCRVVWTG
jgi:tRNA(Arg) A34 adenosine deaminase TadA